MPYTGPEPARRPLSSDDITDGIVSTADLADSAVTTAKIGDATLTSLSSVMSSTATAAAQRAALGLDTGNTPDFTGITLGGGAEALSAYDEGFVTNAWTPVVTFGGASVGQTYSLQRGIYLKIGKICFIVGNVTFTAKGSSTGQARITGLPFTAANISGVPVGSVVFEYIDNWNVVASTMHIGGQVGGGGAVINVFWESVDNTTSTAPDNTHFNNNTGFGFSAWYLTA
jgi:hypothetical protein